MMEKIQEINCRTQHLNELLRKYSGREAGIFFCSNWPQFLLASDHPEEELLSRDGLHLTPKGICCLLGSVEKYVSGVIKKEKLTLKHAPEISKPPTTDHPVPLPPIWPILMNSVPSKNQPPPTQCISLPEYSVVQWPPLQNSALACSTAVPPLPVWPSIKISMASQSTYLRGQRQPLSTPSLPLLPKPSDLNSHVSPKTLRGQRQPPSSLPLLPPLSKSSACTSPFSPITATKPFTLLDRPISTYFAMSSSPMVDTTSSKNTNHCYNSLMSNQMNMATPEPHNDSLYFDPSVSPQNVFPSENNSSDSSLFSWQFVRKRHSYKAEKQEAPCSPIPLSNRFSVQNPSIHKVDCKVLPSSVINPSPPSFSPSSRKPSMLSKSHARRNSNFNTLTYQPHICRPVRRQRRKPSCDFFYSSSSEALSSDSAPTMVSNVSVIIKAKNSVHSRYVYPGHGRR
ncbi:uncharacterized protein LOC124157803 [Ischnura elegans]|uniref:uncharacterized protein LOC124157803 n=1 Tax=Ischnura elegans TaxID=197161 RepID=UPI001ED89D63|nr:uncharacterized protein LOC124157803 [Ischnura elegans]